MRETFIDAGGIRTRYWEAGSGPPLVLVHGGHFGRHAFSDEWDLAIERLARRFRVLAPDKIGNGHTDNPKRDEDYVIGATVGHLRDFMTALGLDRASVVGHSRGGYCVTRLALESPERVAGLVIVSSATLMIPPNPIYRQWDAKAAAITDERARTRFLLTSNSCEAAHVSESLIDRLLAAQNLPKTREADRKMKDGLFASFSADLVERQKETHAMIRAGRLKAPTLIVWGFNDPSAAWKPIGQDCVDLVMSSHRDTRVHVINRAGHYVHREQPDGFAAAVGDFAARLG